MKCYSVGIELESDSEVMAGIPLEEEDGHYWIDVGDKEVPVEIQGYPVDRWDPRIQDASLDEDWHVIAREGTETESEVLVLWRLVFPAHSYRIESEKARMVSVSEEPTAQIIARGNRLGWALATRLTLLTAIRIDGSVSVSHFDTVVTLSYDGRNIRVTN